MSFRFNSLCALCAFAMSAFPWAAAANAQGPGLPDQLLALHWTPGAAEDARRLTLAAAVMLERLGPEENIVEDALARRMDSELAAGRRWFEWAPQGTMGDGLYAMLVNRLEWRGVELTEPVPGTVDATLILRVLIESDDEQVASALAAHWQAEAGRSAPSVWRRVAARTDGDEQAAITALWSEIENQAGDGIQQRALDLAQLARALDLATPEQRPERLVRFRLLEVEHRFAHDEVLGAVWSLLELLIELAEVAPHQDPRSGSGTSFSLREHVAMLAEEYRDALAAVDPVLLTSMAQIGDAGALLVAGDELHMIARPLADAYGQLALFMPDTDFYLEQPVRGGIRESLALCREAAESDEVLGRQSFDACLAALFGAVTHDARTDDLAGDRRGPFTPEALRRELGLVSWQRIRYLLGYLDWVLGGNCPAPEVFNVLETALGVEQISYWTSRRQVYFRSERWQDAASELRGNLLDAAAGINRWTDCVAGSGGARRDPVERLIAAYRLELMQLNGALSDAREQFREQALSQGADVRFGAGPEQQTNWRPEGLRVGPCDPDRACGVNALLPVTRAILGKFPQPYLLAAQTGMGDIQLCYDNVRWTDRQQEPSRRDDERVANYHGRLSFELAGRYSSGGEGSDVFRLRLTTPGRFHYLFGASDPEVMELDCPRQLVGRRIESKLSDSAVRLVPDRLTYFTTAPATPASLIAANWDRGHEWRDWFLTGQHVERLVEDDGMDLMPALDAQLRRLAAEQDRTVTARLLRRPSPGETDPLTLNMARLSDLKSLIRRALELVHPMVLRYDDDIRSSFTGGTALLDREQVRRLRDADVPVHELPRVAVERVDLLRGHWLEQPATLRHGGQPSPELVHALLRLAELEQ